MSCGGGVALSCPGPVSESAAATAFAKTVVSKFGKCLNAALLKTKTPALNNNQYSALVSFTFNAGCNSAESLLTTAAGDLAKLPKLMRSYNKAMFEGVKTIVHSLQVRRSAEIDLFNSKASSPCASLAGPTAFLETESDEAEEAEEAAEEEEETESEEEEEAEAEAEDESESESEEEEEVEAEEESEDESEDESEEAEDSEDSEEAESFVESGWYDKTRDPQYGPVSLPRVTGPVPPTPTNKPAPSSHAQIRDAERQSIAAASQPFPVHPQPKFAAPTGLAPSTDGSVAAEGEDTGRVNWVRDKSQIRRPRQLRLVCTTHHLLLMSPPRTHHHINSLTRTGLLSLYSLVG